MRRFARRTGYIAICLSLVFLFPECAPLTIDDDGQNIVVIHGLITADTVWNSSSKEYYIDGDLTINANVAWGKKIRVRIADGAGVRIDGDGKLTIAEGVTVASGTGSYIEVGYSTPGTLVVRGSDSLPVLFTRTSGAQDWGCGGISGSGAGGILLQDNATAQTLLDHCIIEYATTGIYVNTVRPVITNCIIRNNSSFGINFDAVSSPKDSASFINNSITGNGNYPLCLDAEGLTRLSGDTYINGNAPDEILVFGGAVTHTGTWKKHGVPYFFSNAVWIGSVPGVTITMSPGVVCMFSAGAYLEVGYTNTAALIANGTAQDSIKFTNAAGGGYWGSDGADAGGILLYDKTATTTSLTYCLIEGATAGIFVQADVTIRNCTIRDNQGYGIGYHDNTIPTANVTDNTLSNNNPDTTILN
jgi:hypothetical protein